MYGIMTGLEAGHMSECNLFLSPPERAINTCDISLCYILHLDF